MTTPSQGRLTAAGTAFSGAARMGRRRPAACLPSWHRRRRDKLCRADRRPCRAARQVLSWDMPAMAARRRCPRCVSRPSATGSAPRRSLGLDRVVLAGQSIGGMIAQEMAIRHPRRIAGLVLIATVPAFGGRDDSFRDSFLAARLAPLDRGDSMESLAAEAIPAVMSLVPTLPPSVTPSRQWRPFPNQPIAGCWQRLTFNRREDQHRITCPCLLIAGGEDDNSPPRVMEKMASRLADASFQMIETAGHLVNGEAPEACNLAMRLSCSALPVTGDDERNTSECAMTAAHHGRRRGTGRPDLRSGKLAADRIRAALAPRRGRLRRRNSPPAPRKSAGRPGSRPATGIFAPATCWASAFPATMADAVADLRAYMLAAAEIEALCGATALTFNMHVSSCLWTGVLADGVEMSAAQRAEHAAMRARHYGRILDQGAIYAQPFSEGGDAAAGKAAFGPRGGDRWRLDRQWREDFRLAVRPCRSARRPAAPNWRRRDRARRAPTPCISPSRVTPRACRSRKLGPARHARDGLANAGLPRCLHPVQRAADAARCLFQCRQTVAAHVHDADPQLCGDCAGGL